MEAIILILLLIGLTIATYSDIKTKEVPNWLNFSIIISLFSFYLFSSLISNNWNILIISLIGFGIFFTIGNIMYYTKQWGGGDSKILMMIGAAIPEYPEFLLKYFNPSLNMNFLIILFINIMIVGAIYSIILGIILGIKNKEKLIKYYKEKSKIKNIKKLKKITIYFSISGILLSMIMIKNFQFKLSAIIILALPLVLFYFWLTISAIEKASMIKTINSNKLREGDYITHQIKVNKQIIYKPSTQGITKEQIKLLNKNKIKKIIIKDGIPFLPAIILAVIISLIFGNVLMYVLT